MSDRARNNVIAGRIMVLVGEAIESERRACVDFLLAVAPGLTADVLAEIEAGTYSQATATATAKEAFGVVDAFRCTCGHLRSQHFTSGKCSAAERLHGVGWPGAVLCSCVAYSAIG